MAVYRLINGRHRVGKDRLVASDPQNNIIVTDSDLIRIFPNKFELVVEAVDKPEDFIKEERKESVATEKHTEQVEQEEEETREPLGEDVTEKFAMASDKDLKVFRVEKDKKTVFVVTTAEDQFTALNGESLNLKSLRTFLDKYGEDEE